MAFIQLKEALSSFEEDFSKIIIRNNDDLFVMSFESFEQARIYLIKQDKEAYLEQNVKQIRVLTDTVEFSI
ncbi:MAG: hypothetical protein K2J93_01590 [Anaeroplasmataceae bacterium]|nr:hypothetical protein [Anaeroplasmataceae bacterium]